MSKFTTVDVLQRSPEWMSARAGRLCGSRAGDMLATIKSGEAAARRDLRLQLVVERLTGQPQEDCCFVSKDMQRGIDKEAEAFAAYEALTGQLAERVGFLQHNEFMMGCSPDGLLAGDGLLELKVPRSATHLRYLRTGGLPSEHLSQVLHNLYVGGFSYCDFMSFDDRFPANLQTFLVRVEARTLDLKAYEAKALAFLAEVDRDVAAVATLADVGAVLREAVTHG